MQERSGAIPGSERSTISESGRTSGKSCDQSGIRLHRTPTLPPNDLLFRSPSRLHSNSISPMTILPIAGVILLALWLVETVIFLVGYRQTNSDSS